MHRRKHINNTAFFGAIQCDHSIILKSKNCRSNVTIFSNCELRRQFWFVFPNSSHQSKLLFQQISSKQDGVQKLSQMFSQNVQFFDQIFDSSCSLVFFSSNCRIFSTINLHLPFIRCVDFAYCLNFYSILSRF